MTLSFAKNLPIDVFLPIVLALIFIVAVLLILSKHRIDERKEREQRQEQDRRREEERKQLEEQEKRREEQNKKKESDQPVDATDAITAAIPTHIGSGDEKFGTPPEYPSELSQDKTDEASTSNSSEKSLTSQEDATDVTTAATPTHIGSENQISETVPASSSKLSQDKTDEASTPNSSEKSPTSQEDATDVTTAATPTHSVHVVDGTKKDPLSNISFVDKIKGSHSVDNAKEFLFSLRIKMSEACLAAYDADNGTNADTKICEPGKRNKYIHFNVKCHRVDDLKKLSSEVGNFGIPNVGKKPPTCPTSMGPPSSTKKPWKCIICSRTVSEKVQKTLNGISLGDNGGIYAIDEYSENELRNVFGQMIEQKKTELEQLMGANGVFTEVFGKLGIWIYLPEKRKSNFQSSLTKLVRSDEKEVEKFKEVASKKIE